MQGIDQSVSRLPFTTVGKEKFIPIRWSVNRPGREIIRPYPLGAIPRADLPFPLGSIFGVFFFFLRLEQARAQYRHRFVSILMLRSLIRTIDGYPSRLMNELHGGIRCIDMLSARSRSAHGRNFLDRRG